MPLTPSPGVVPECESVINCYTPEAAAWSIGRGLAPTSVVLHPEGGEALEALEALIDSAHNQIDVLMFQWENDSVGAALAAHLSARAGPDLRVRILVDGGGNLIFGHCCCDRDPDVNGVVRDLARQPYVEVIRNRNPFGHFDHRKLVVIDGQVAWTGGRNFTARSFFENHDLSFTVTGPLAAELAVCFEHYWRQQGGSPGVPPSPSESPPCSDQANAWARLVATGPVEHAIENAVYHAVDGARHHVYLENFTFCDGRLLYKLARARRRGVDVRVIMTLSCLNKVVNCTNRVTANRLLRAGVRVYIYPTMTHVKAATVDGSWAYLGTGNFDPLSMRWNRELGLAVHAGPLIGSMEECLFEPDLRPEWELRKPFPLSRKDYLGEILSSLFL
jgi:cardiolipin synthase